MSAGQSTPGLSEEKGGAEEKEKSQEARGPRRWSGRWADLPLREVALPAGAPTVEHLRRYYAGKIFEDDLLIPCPKASNPWWWTYCKYCRACAGHPLCLLDFVMTLTAPAGDADAPAAEPPAPARVAPSSLPLASADGHKEGESHA
jgi:hypothetical protein